MTLDEIRQSRSLCLTAADIAPVLEVDAAAIRLQAQKDPSKLGFPVTVIGNRVKIPRRPFLSFFGE